MYNHVNPKNNEPAPLVADDVYEIICKVRGFLLAVVCKASLVDSFTDMNVALFLQNSERLDSEIIYDRDFDYDYFGFKVCLVFFLCHSCRDC